MVNEFMAPDLWIIATLCAATFQTIRFTLQKILADGNLSPLGATYSRFIFAAPLILLFSIFFFSHNRCFSSKSRGPVFVIRC